MKYFFDMYHPYFRLALSVLFFSGSALSSQAQRKTVPVNDKMIMYKGGLTTLPCVRS
jgi:hypothetical protein